MNDTLRLSVSEMWRALEQIDPVDALVDELIHGAPAGQRLTPWPTAAGDQVMIEDLATEQCCVLPAAALRALDTAARCAFAARQLLGRMVVTVGVIGSGLTGQFVLSMIARHLPGVSHVALYPDGDGGAEPWVVDQLDLAGIGYTVTEGPAAATRGGNLVIALGPGAPDVRPEQLSPRAVLVNAAGEDLPHQLVDRVEEIYVDHAGLLEANAHRYFARTDRLNGDFRQLLDRPSGVNHLEKLVLVELLGTQAVNTALAQRLHLAARRHRLGRPVVPSNERP